MKLKTKLILIGVGILLPNALMILLSFGSGNKLKDYYESHFLGNVALSQPQFYMKQIEDNKWDVDDYGDFQFTKEDMAKIFEEVMDANGECDKDDPGHGTYHATTVYYQYYWETWCVVEYFDPDKLQGYVTQADGSQIAVYGAWCPTPKESEYDEEEVKSNLCAKATFFKWGWHGGYRPNNTDFKKEMHDHDTVNPWGEKAGDTHAENKIILDNEDFERDPKYHVDWQTVYALAMIASSKNVQNWYEEEGEIIDEETGEVTGTEKRIALRLEDGVLDEIIATMKFSLTYGYEGAWDSDKSGYQQRYYLITGEELPENMAKSRGVYVTKTDYSSWDYELGGYSGYKWDQLEDISYTVESEGNWDIKEWGRAKYKRRLYKIPETSLIAASNAYESYTYYVKENEIDVENEREKFKYYDYGVSPSGKSDHPDSAKADSEGVFSFTGEALTNLDDEHGSNCPGKYCGGYQHNYQIEGGLYVCDAQKLETAFVKIVGEEEWNWNRFITILETLPDSEDIVAKYEEIAETLRKAKKTGSSTTVSKKILPTETLRDGKEVIIGKGNDHFSSKSVGGKILVPDVAYDYNEDEQMDRPLTVSDDLSEEQIKYLLNNFYGYLANPKGVLVNADLDELASRLAAFQDEKQVSIIGLLAIANLESGYQTNSLAKNNWNFISMKGLDGDWIDFKTYDGVSSPVDALIANFERIYRLWFNNTYQQDTYYKMQFNTDASGNAAHQWTPDSGWAAGCAVIRQQMEKCLGIAHDERKLIKNMSDELNEKLENLETKNYKDGETLIWPTNYTRISDYFGSRVAPKEGASTNHRGLDLAAPEGTAIRAAGDGVVSRIDFSTKGGQTVYISHGNGIQTVYMHMVKNSPLKYVQVNQAVEQGEIIGEVGSTGNVTGPHLHFQVMENGSAVDPLNYLGR